MVKARKSIFFALLIVCFVMMASFFVKVNGYCICMKGSNVKDELDNAKNALNILGGIIEDVIEFDLPDTDIGRSIVIIKKIKQTPNKYPRKAGTPSKEPIV